MTYIDLKLHATKANTLLIVALAGLSILVLSIAVHLIHGQVI